MTKRTSMFLWGLCAVLASGAVAAAPKVSLGAVSYTGAAPFVSVPVTLSNDGGATALQFGLQYPNGSVTLAAILAGDVLGADNNVYSAPLIGGPTNMTTWRVVVTPTAANTALLSGKILSVPLQVTNTAGAVGTVLSVTNV